MTFKIGSIESLSKSIEIKYPIINAIKRRAKDIKKKYGITANECLLKWIDQKGKCYLCEQELTERFNVDHLHKKDAKNKQIIGDKTLTRGLLCYFCNKWVLHPLEHRNKVSAYKLLKNLVKYSIEYRLKE